MPHKTSSKNGRVAHTINELLPGGSPRGKLPALQRGRSGGRANLLLLPLLAAFATGSIFLVAALFAVQTPAAAAQPMQTETRSFFAPTPTCVPAWAAVPGPSVQPTPNTLTGIEAISSQDVWMVGFFGYSGGTGSGAITAHWDGSKWSIVPSLSNTTVALRGVAAVSSSDVWAVGSIFGTDYVESLVIHWDGSSWTRIPSPNPGLGTNWLHAVDVISASDIWAVGTYNSNGGPVQSLTLHWDGSVWTHVPTPTTNSGSSYLRSVHGAAANDVWAVGYYKPLGEQERSLALHWDGTAWSIVTTPNPTELHTRLSGVAAIAPDDAWAVGAYLYESSEARTLILHWNGSSWSQVAAPSLDTVGHYTAVTALSATNVWAVGGGVDVPIIAHWDGSAWTLVPPPDPSQLEDTASFSAISASSPTNIWAAGAFPAVARYTGLCATSTPTRTATYTATPTRTATRVPPTPHAGQFEDVPPPSTFYPYVECMGTNGIISGYECGGAGEPCIGPANKPYFRPNNNITRGQLSKIVANSAGFTEPVEGQSFEDVPSSNTFYLYAERMSRRGIIGGYNCGSTGEPCGPGNRPYFRPNANATRGQISKIVSEARGYNDPTGNPIFQDVPSSNTFFTWIQRLASRGIMGGYPCGGAGEPCGSGNLPYFRPNNNATRGQASKIVAGAFYPECSP